MESSPSERAEISDMTGRVLMIEYIPYPNMDEKMFHFMDDETWERIGEPYSYNDWIRMIKDISGVSEDLKGKYEDKS